MATTRVENLPAIWDDARDIPFFRIPTRLFTSEFCLGASVLLASYDDDTLGAVQVTPAENGSSTTAPATVDTHACPERDLMCVRVRHAR